MEEEKKLYGQEYDIPELEESFIDDSGEVQSKKDLTPFQIIKEIGRQNGYEVKDPKKSCKKCYGRGYTGIEKDTRIPLPCSCIFETRTPNQKMSDNIVDRTGIVNQPKYNRYEKRKLQKNYKKILKNYKKKNINVVSTDEVSKDDN